MLEPLEIRCDVSHNVTHDCAFGSQLDVSHRADVVVIGGGVIGAATAWWLEQAGRDVLVLERRSEIGTLTTPNALGTIRTQYGTPTLIEMAQESLDFYRNIEARLGVSHAELAFSNPGYLYLSTDRDHGERLAGALANYQAMGVTSSEYLEEAAIKQRFGFAGDSVAAIFHGDGSFVDPARITGAWASGCESVRFQTDTAVHDLSPIADDGWRLETNHGDIDARQVVIAAGPYTPGLLAQFGVELPVRVTPRYKAFIPDDDPEHAAAPLVINIANGAYWRPVPGGVWLSHANVDDRSLPPAQTITVPPEFLDEAINQIEPVSPRLAETARHAKPSEVKLMGGFQVYPADDAPIIGEVPGTKNLYLNSGHWAGVMLSPASGRLMADVVTGAIAEQDNICRLGRFDDGTAQRHSTNKFGGWG